MAYAVSEPHTAQPVSVTAICRAQHCSDVSPKGYCATSAPAKRTTRRSCNRNSRSNPQRAGSQRCMRAETSHKTASAMLQVERNRHGRTTACKHCAPPRSDRCRDPLNILMTAGSDEVSKRQKTNRDHVALLVPIPSASLHSHPLQLWQSSRLLPLRAQAEQRATETMLLALAAK